MYLTRNNARRLWYLQHSDARNLMFVTKRPIDWYARNSVLSEADASYLVGKGGWDLRLL